MKRMYEILLRNGKKYRVDDCESMSEAADHVMMIYGVAGYDIKDINEISKPLDRPELRGPYLNGISPGMPQPQYCPPPMPSPYGEPPLKGLDKAMADMERLWKKNKGCSHNWKTDQYFSATKYTTCTKCGAKKEEL